MAVFPQLRRQRSKREEPIGEIPGGQRHRAILLMPGMIWLVIFSILPLALVVVYSFASRGTYGGIEFKWTLENYARLADRLYLAILWRSFLFAFATTVLCLVLGYPMAYAIASSPEPRKNRLLLLIVVPFWTNFLIRTYAWIIILRGQGLINGLLMHLGLISEPLRMLYTPGAVLLGFVYNWLPFMILPLYASLEKIDRSYIEAAMDLGAQRSIRVDQSHTAPVVARHCRRLCFGLHSGTGHVRHSGPARRSPHHVGRQSDQEPVPVGPQLAFWLSGLCLFDRCHAPGSFHL